MSSICSTFLLRKPNQWMRTYGIQRLTDVSQQHARVNHFHMYENLLAHTQTLLQLLTLQHPPAAGLD